jgi:hypothetical protein
MLNLWYKIRNRLILLYLKLERKYYDSREINKRVKDLEIFLKNEKRYYDF